MDVLALNYYLQLFIHLLSASFCLGSKKTPANGSMIYEGVCESPNALQKTSHTELLSVLSSNRDF